jgi:hypothetical protein
LRADQGEAIRHLSITAGGQPRSTSTWKRSRMTTATVTIFVIAILIVAAIAWNTVGGRRDLDRRRHRGRDPGAPD